jgi:hypothetical protein
MLRVHRMSSVPGHILIALAIALVPPPIGFLVGWARKGQMFFALHWRIITWYSAAVVVLFFTQLLSGLRIPHFFGVLGLIGPVFALWMAGGGRLARR